MSRPAKLTDKEVKEWAAAQSGWTLGEDLASLRQDFEFRDFVTAWTFMCRIAAKAQEMDHHPEWSNVYNRVSIRLTTHDMGGLTRLDLNLADSIDQILTDT